MNLLVENILLVALIGLALAVISNLILLWGRKEGISIKDVLTSGHLNRRQREKIFTASSIRIASVLGYVGVGLFLFAVLIIVASVLWQPD